MKVLHQVVTEKAFKNAAERSVMNHRTETPSFLYYGKGRYDDSIYAQGNEVRSRKCSFQTIDVIPFDLALVDDLKYFRNSYKTFVHNIASGMNHSVNVCEVDMDGNFVRVLEESEVLSICKE